MSRKAAFFEGWSWFKFNNLGLALGMCKFYTSVEKELKLIVIKFDGPVSTFLDDTGDKLVEGAFLPTRTTPTPLNPE